MRNNLLIFKVNSKVLISRGLRSIRLGLIGGLTVRRCVNISITLSSTTTKARTTTLGRFSGVASTS